MQAKFVGHTVFCRDMHKAARFYAEAFGWPAEEGDDGALRVSVPLSTPGNGKVTLLLHPTDEKPVPIDLGTFEVDDVDAQAAKVRSAGGAVGSGPQNTPWGVREAGVSDLDGHGFYLEGPATS